VDKGNKKGNKNLATFVCWYDVDEKKVKTYLIDTDCADESTKKICDAIHHSLTLFFDKADYSLRGQNTDIGGGGTKEALARELDVHNVKHSQYLISTCVLHNLQTCLRNAVENVTGLGGQNEKGEYKMNVMQMLHGAYNIQNWQEVEELKEVWSFVQDADGLLMRLTFKRLEEPILTRWWLVGACVCSFKESFSV
jgi:hypothetical protein